MKSLTKLMAMGLLSVGLAACSSDDEALPQGGQTFNEGDKVYMSLNLDFPTSRAVGTPGLEVGTTEENNVSTVQVVLTSADGGIVASSNVGTFKPSNSKTGKSIYTAAFNAKDLIGLAGQSNVKLYAVCNGTIDALKLMQDAKALTLSQSSFADLAGQSYWKNNSFLMANANGASTVAAIPSEAELMLNNSTEATSLNLGTVKVERAAARLDYNAAVAENKYAIDEQKTGEKVAVIELTDFTVANVNKSFYTLVRSNDGTLGGAQAFGHGGNFVVDTEWAHTNTAELDLLQPTTATPDIDAVGADGLGCYAKYTYSSLAGLTQPDNWQGSASDPTLDAKDYKVMTYLTENTIPADNAYDKKGAATAVIFKGVIRDNGTQTPQELKDALNSDAPVIVYDNMLLGDWTMVAALAAGDGTGESNPFNKKATEFQGFVQNYKLALAEAGAGEITHQIALDHGFTVYETDGNKNHEVYYYYWNEHDANMTYSVVRNNVYKLKVNKILKYGLPRNGSVDPEEPIVSNDIYFNLSVDVLPWAVKVNDIEF